jgi:hypothetical protein
VWLLAEPPTVRERSELASGAGVTGQKPEGRNKISRGKLHVRGTEPRNGVKRSSQVQPVTLLLPVSHPVHPATGRRADFRLLTFAPDPRPMTPDTMAP